MWINVRKQSELLTVLKAGKAARIVEPGFYIVKRPGLLSIWSEKVCVIADCTTIIASKDAVVCALGNTYVHAFDDVQVIAGSHATVRAYNRVRVDAHDSAVVWALAESTVKTHGDDAVVHLYGHARLVNEEPPASVSFPQGL